MTILSTLGTTGFDEVIRCASKWFMLTLKENPQNLELVNVKSSTYPQPILLSLTQFISLVPG